MKRDEKSSEMHQHRTGLRVSQRSANSVSAQTHRPQIPALIFSEAAKALSQDLFISLYFRKYK